MPRTASTLAARHGGRRRTHRRAGCLRIRRLRVRRAAKNARLGPAWKITPDLAACRTPDATHIIDRAPRGGMDGAGGGPAVPATGDVVYALLRDNAPLVRKLLEAAPFIDPRGHIGEARRQGGFFSTYAEFDRAATAPAAGAVRAAVRLGPPG